MLFGFLGKTWTLIIQFLFYFILNLWSSLLLLFHPRTHMCYWSQNLCTNLTCKESTPGNASTKKLLEEKRHNFHHRSLIEAQLCLRASCWSQWEALPVSLCSGKSFWSYITLLQARSPLCKLFLCCCWFRDSSRVSSGNLMLQLQCSIKHTAPESAGAHSRPAVVAA